MDDDLETDGPDDQETDAGTALEPVDIDDGEYAEGAESRAILSVPVEVTASVGKARPLISDMMSLRRDSVIPLDSRIEDPVEIYVGDRLIARGELLEIEGQNGQLGVRLTEVAEPG